MITPPLGTVIAIRCWWGEHWGIVAADVYGQITVISNRGVKNGVTEELWSEVVGDANWRVVNELASQIPAYFVIQRARSKIGTRYDLLKWNCQDFVHWALGYQPRSPQRDAAVVLLAAAFLGALVLKGARSS